MSHKYSTRAQSLFTHAKEEAARCGQSHIEPEHLLYAVLRDEASVAMYLLTRFGVTADWVRAELEPHCPSGSAEGVRELEPSPAGRRVFDFAKEESERTGSSYIGTEHILLGLIADQESLAGRVLATAGVDLAGTRAILQAIENGDRGELGDSPPRLFRFLLEKGYISRQQIYAVEIYRKFNQRDIRELLIEEGVDPFSIYIAYFAERGEPAFDLRYYDPPKPARRMLFESVARMFEILPLKREGDTLYVAMRDTLNEDALKFLSGISGCKVRGIWAASQQIKAAIDRVYSETSAEEAAPSTSEEPTHSTTEVADMASQLASLERKLLEKRSGRTRRVAPDADETAEAELARLESKYGGTSRDEASAPPSDEDATVSEGGDAVSEAQRVLQAIIHEDRAQWRGRSLVTLADVSAQQVRVVLNVAALFKELQRKGEFLYFNHPKTLGLLFEKPSLRTRVSFEAGMAHLAGRAIYLAPSDVGLGVREPVADVAACLSRWVDIIAARTFKHETVEELSANATVPVINALSDREHPIQAFADLLTIQEAKGKLGNHLKVAYVGDGNNVLNALMLACAKVEVNITAACPNGYEPDSAYVWESRQCMIGERPSRARIEIVNDPSVAVWGADVIYTDVWTSMGQEAESAERRKIFTPYQVNAALLREALPDVIVLHCLPAHRDEEISTEVMDAYRTTIQDQAENRLHTQKALIALMLGLS